MLILDKTIIWASYLVFPLIILLVFFLFQKKTGRKAKILSAIFLFLSLLFVWTRFIEPKIILVKSREIKIGFSSKIALIADIHLGVFKNENFLKKAVEKINRQNPDYTLIAGDFVYDLAKEDLGNLFRPLSEINSPVFAVLGNHDHSKDGNLKNKVIDALEKNDVHVIENKSVELNNFILIGLGDHQSKEDNVFPLEKYPPKDNIIVLAHNPDTTLKFSDNSANLTLCGHTHGGQIRLPFIYKKIIPTEGNFDRGLSREKNALLFITAGLGEVMLPMRFLNPPAIDILYLK